MAFILAVAGADAAGVSRAAGSFAGMTGGRRPMSFVGRLAGRAVSCRADLQGALRGASFAAAGPVFEAAGPIGEARSSTCRMLPATKARAVSSSTAAAVSARPAFTPHTPERFRAFRPLPVLK